MENQSLRNLLEKADRYLAGGCLGSFRMPDDVATVIQRGSGCRIYDIEGRDYIDYILGSGPLILGHAHPAVVEAVQRQVALGSTFYALNEPIIRLAERIVEASPCGESIRFTSSGTEGTFSALRMARAFTGREKILKFEGWLARCPRLRPAEHDTPTAHGRTPGRRRLPRHTQSRQPIGSRRPVQRCRRRRRTHRILRGRPRGRYRRTLSTRPSARTRLSGSHPTSFDGPRHRPHFR